MSETDEITAISGTRRQYKEMADGTLRVTIDIDPPQKQAFLTLFPEIDMPVALSPLKADFEQKKEGKPKGGPLSKSAAQMCEHPPFQSFVVRHWPENDPCPTDPAIYTVLYIRRRCGIESRAELDSNPEAAKRFHELMREYRQWNSGEAA